MEIEGYPVLETIPDFADNPQSSARRGFSMVASSQAARVVAYRAKRIVEGFSHKFVFASRAQVANIEQFFEARCGRWEPFWLPSWRADLSLIADIAAAATSASISWVGGYGATYDPSGTDTKALGHYLYMVKPDLTTFAPRVSSVGLSSFEVAETLNFADAAPDDFPALGTVVCFLHFVRFTEDELQLRYSGPNAATCEIGFVEVTTSEGEADV